MEPLAYLHLALTHEQDCPLCGQPGRSNWRGTIRLEPQNQHIRIQLPGVAHSLKIAIEWGTSI